MKIWFYKYSSLQLLEKLRDDCLVLADNKKVLITSESSPNK